MASPGTCILATFIKTPPSGAPFNFRASPNLAAIRLGFGYMAVPRHIHINIYMWILIHLQSRLCIRQIGQRNRFLGQNLRRCKTSALFNNTVCLLNRSQNFWHRRKPSSPGLLRLLLLQLAASWWGWNGEAYFGRYYTEGKK